MPTLRRCRDKSHRGGFTLIELIVVMVILGLLAGLVGPKVWRWATTSTPRIASVQIANFRQALNMFQFQCGRYPTTAEGLRALVEDPGGIQGWDGSYLEQDYVPRDPWGNEYQYRSPGEHGDYDLWSNGADGVPGGEGANADVTSWAPAPRPGS